MRIKTNNPTVMDKVLRILSENNITVTKKNGKEATVESPPAENEVRQVLQQGLDADKFDFTNDSVLVDGNSVWSYALVKKELERIKKSGTTEKITKYFYNFMHLNFTIAHYNLAGWIQEYPTWDDVSAILNGASVPSWKTDVNRIVEFARNLENVKA